ncbi:DUF2510 domain-containing protein [Kitasatospora sp. NPDC059795]|uniref:DUF2510 domain-containing protein n=1 Tax=Kitasatospora sp. NPDC059795 TaxID=3346949 RepID=UPI003649DDAD
MSEQQIPAGWYPDPVDTDSDPRPERWWDGKGWTASTRPASAAPADTPAPAPAPTVTAAAAAPGTPTDAVPPPAPGAFGMPGIEDTTVLEGTVLDASGQSVHYPPPPPYGELPPAKPRRRPSRPVLITAAVAALLGLAVGSGATYLVMDGRTDKSASARPSLEGRSGHKGSGDGGQNGQNTPGDGLPSFPGQGGGSGGNGGNSNGKGVAVDLVNGISLPVPSGWKGGTSADGFAAATVGDYTCADGQGSCSLGGVTTGRIAGTGNGGGTDVKQAAQQDIENAAKEAYPDITGHQELKSEAVTVAGRSGYLVRWQVTVSKGNSGYVQTVVFPTADGKALTAVHFGFDIADKAPGLDQMDTILKGIATFQGGGPGAGTTT